MEAVDFLRVFSNAPYAYVQAGIIDLVQTLLNVSGREVRVRCRRTGGVVVDRRVPRSAGRGARGR